MPTRRSFLGHSTTAALGLPLLASAAADAHGTMKTGALPALPDISFATREPFLHRERAQAVLTAEGLDAVVVGEGRNLFYATNFFPLMERMSLMATTLAVIPRDLRKPVALVIPGFSYYYIQSDDGLVPGVQPFVFTGPAGYTDSRRTEDEPPAADPRFYRLDGEASAREQRRRAAVEAAAPYTSSMERALALALAELGIKGGRIGYDHGSIPPLLARALPGATAVSAEDTLRRVRLVRTAPEIRMMRLAAQANVDAALATVRATREVGTLRALRQRYYAEVAARGNLAHGLRGRADCPHEGLHRRHGPRLGRVAAVAASRPALLRGAKPGQRHPAQDGHRCAHRLRPAQCRPGPQRPAARGARRQPAGPRPREGHDPLDRLPPLRDRAWRHRPSRGPRAHHGQRRRADPHRAAGRAHRLTGDPPGAGNCWIAPRTTARAPRATHDYRRRPEGVPGLVHIVVEVNPYRDADCPT